MKKSAETYLNVLLFVVTFLLVSTVAYTVLTGESPYETAGMDPTLGVMVTLAVVALLFTVPHLLNLEWRSKR